MCIATNHTSFSVVEMDTKAIEILTKGLYTKKRKGKASSDGSKSAKVGASNSTVPTSTTAISKVIASTEVALNAKAGIAGVGSMPPMPSGPSSGDRASELPIEGEIGEGRKKKKAATKTSRKARLSGLDGDNNK
ncbi:hypothetical protein COCNU_scaffold003272G000040 [Cocos nucifera]|nr:hypothetical protein [Cocos nucifera]